MKRDIYISVIIPTYNSWDTLVRLLATLKSSSYKNFEVIIGDDASRTEKPKDFLQMMRQKIGKRLPHIVRLPINHGPAAARNKAAKGARGHILVFLDADVTVYQDTLSKIAEKFIADADLTALTGAWDKHQKTQAFFPQFKAMRDWSYWTNERDRQGYYYLFSTRIAAIKGDVFRRLGGFNEAFREMEDVEITYKIARRYAIIFAPDVRVHHEFEGFFAVARKYFWRSFYWMRLYKQRRKFDPVATTALESMAALTAVASMASVALGVVVFFVIPSAGVREITVMGSGIFLLLHILLLRRFLFFVGREKGMRFMLLSLLTGMALYGIIVAGSIYSFIFSYISTQKRRPLGK